MYKLEFDCLLKLLFVGQDPLGNRVEPNFDLFFSCIKVLLMNLSFKSFLASSDVCHLLIAFANSLDPDQD